MYAAGLFVSTFLWELTTGALFAGATMRAEGRTPTVRTALAAAWHRRGPLMAWALLSTGVGVVLSALERFGAAGLVVRLLSGIAWGAATMFVVPVLMTEGSGPVASIRTSAKVLIAKFGPNVRATVQLGVAFTVVCCVAGGFAVVGFGVLFTNRHDGITGVTVFGGMVAALGTLVLVICLTVGSAVDVYLRTVLYRYATGRPTPGIDPAALPTPAS